MLMGGETDAQRMMTSTAGFIANHSTSRYTYRSFIHMHATYIPVRSSLAVDQAPRKMPVGDGRLPLFWSLIGVIFSLLFFDLDEPVLGVNAARAVRKAHCAANTILAVIPARSAHGISIMQVSARKTTSTILDGNHAVPPLYVCYLLRSRATPDSRLTYVSNASNVCYAMPTHP
jgi:hypothetical protein